MAVVLENQGEYKNKIKKQKSNIKNTYQKLETIKVKNIFLNFDF